MDYVVVVVLAVEGLPVGVEGYRVPVQVDQHEGAGSAPFAPALRVAGVERYAGVDAFHLTRASTIGLTGQGSQRGMRFTVTGRGTGRADLYLDPTAGRFLGGTGESTVELELTSPGSVRQRVRQEGRVRVEGQ